MNHLLPVVVLLQILAVSFLGSLVASVIASYVAAKINRSCRATSVATDANALRVTERILAQKISLLTGQDASLASVKPNLQGLGSLVLNSQTNANVDAPAHE